MHGKRQGGVQATEMPGTLVPPDNQVPASGVLRCVSCAVHQPQPNVDNLFVLRMQHFIQRPSGTGPVGSVVRKNRQAVPGWYPIPADNRRRQRGERTFLRIAFGAPCQIVENL